jgi:hypothetical protein
MDVTDFKGPIIVTLAYFIVYYGFLLNIMRTRFSLHKKYQKEGKKFDRYFNQDRNMLAADRIQLNMLEQMPIFVTLLWLQAFFVSIETATIFGWIYTISRAAYPFLIGNRMGRDIPMKVLVSTMIGYGVIAVFIFNLFKAALS